MGLKQDFNDLEQKINKKIPHLSHWSDDFYVNLMSDVIANAFGANDYMDPKYENEILKNIGSFGANESVFAPSSYSFLKTVVTIITAIIKNIRNGNCVSATNSSDSNMGFPLDRMQSVRYAISKLLTYDKTIPDQELEVVFPKPSGDYDWRGNPLYEENYSLTYSSFIEDINEGETFQWRLNETPIGQDALGGGSVISYRRYMTNPPIPEYFILGELVSTTPSPINGDFKVLTENDLQTITTFHPMEFNCDTYKGIEISTTTQYSTSSGFFKEIKKGRIIFLEVDNNATIKFSKTKVCDIYNFSMIGDPMTKQFYWTKGSPTHVYIELDLNPTIPTNLLSENEENVNSVNIFSGAPIISFIPFTDKWKIKQQSSSVISHLNQSGDEMKLSDILSTLGYIESTDNTVNFIPDHNHKPSDIVMPTGGNPLSISVGGTGVTNIADLKHEIGMPTSENPLSISIGGTGVTNITDLKHEIGMRTIKIPKTYYLEIVPNSKNISFFTSTIATSAAIDHIFGGSKNVYYDSIYCANNSKIDPYLEIFSTVAGQQTISLDSYNRFKYTYSTTDNTDSITYRYDNTSGSSNIYISIMNCGCSLACKITNGTTISEAFTLDGDISSTQLFDFEDDESTDI